MLTATPRPSSHRAGGGTGTFRRAELSYLAIKTPGLPGQITIVSQDGG